MAVVSTGVAILVLLGGVTLLTLGAEILVRHATRVALRTGLSPLFVGITIVGFGTSTPELSASLTATLQDNGAIAVGNVIGSNIFNIALILGISALVRPIAVSLRAVRLDLGVAILAAFAPLAALLSGRQITRPLGVVFLLLLAGHLVLSWRSARRASKDDQSLAELELAAALPTRNAASNGRAIAADLAFIVAGLALLVVGARILLTAAVSLAREAGVSELAIGLTIVAAGTSMPELVTSLVAAARRSSDIAVGNVIGSNIFNVFGILGVCSVAGTQDVSGPVLWRDVPVMIVASLALLPIMKSGGRISRAEGGMLLAGFVGYTGLVWWMSRG